jgi:hypothetical protein
VIPSRLERSKAPSRYGRGLHGSVKNAGSVGSNNYTLIAVMQPNDLQTLGRELVCDGNRSRSPGGNTTTS